VSVWRFLLLVNEFNELQVSRYIHIPFTLLMLLLLLAGLDWEQYASSQPSVEITVQNSPIDPVLRFFLNSGLFLVIGYSQVIVRKLLST